VPAISLGWWAPLGETQGRSGDGRRRGDGMSRVKQGIRVELAPTDVQRAAMGRHAGLSRFVENYALGKIRDAFAARAAEQSAGVPADQLTRAPWTGIDLEKLWRSEHPEVAPWFAESGRR
jgi:putative transposase